MDNSVEWLLWTASVDQQNDLEKKLSLPYEQFRKAKPYLNPEAQKHYERMEQMLSYTTNSLIEILRIEFLVHRMFSHVINEGMASQNDLSDKVVQDIDRNVHAYLSQVSTFIDNLHYLAGDQYEIQTAKGKDERKEIRDALKAVNPKLRNHLRRKFCFSDAMQKFNLLRNAAMHEIPPYGVELYKNDGRFNVRLTFSDENKPVVDYLFSLQQYVVENARKVFSLL